jgi:hypothetical protein
MTDPVGTARLNIFQPLCSFDSIIGRNLGATVRVTSEDKTRLAAHRFLSGICE